MIKKWIFYEEGTEPSLLLKDQFWTDDKTEFVIETTFTYKRYHIQFPECVEAVELFHLPRAIVMDDWIYEIMCQNNYSAPLVPSFIRDESELIEKVKEVAGFELQGKTLLHYTIFTEFTFINVVSSVPPKVTRRESVNSIE